VILLEFVVEMFENPMFVELRLPLEDGLGAEVAEEQLRGSVKVEISGRRLKKTLNWIDNYDHC
jgi:hypothetical protein